jgi:hypothetical protein
LKNLRAYHDNVGEIKQCTTLKRPKSLSVLALSIDCRKVLQAATMEESGKDFLRDRVKDLNEDRRQFYESKSRHFENQV